MAASPLWLSSRLWDAIPLCYLLSDKGPEASFEEELGVLGQAQGLERRELKEEDSGPEGGVVTWLGDFVGQS